MCQLTHVGCRNIFELVAIAVCDDSERDILQADRCQTLALLGLQVSQARVVGILSIKA